MSAGNNVYVQALSDELDHEQRIEFILFRWTKELV